MFIDNPRILIVDDEKENLDALVLALGDSNPNWRIMTAQSVRTAESILKSNLSSNNPVDVILTDLVMETESSGMDMLRIARTLDPSIMAILFTAKEKSLDRYSAFDLGAFDVVEKNIRGTTAVKEINIKTRSALRYKEWSRKLNFLQRYFDPKVFSVIESEPSILDLSQRVVTIAFWDIRGFSKLCEILKAHPKLISGFISEYCEIGAKAIFEQGGVLDKFIGDGIMALFGVLNHKDDGGNSDALAAVRAAHSLRLKFDDLVAKWKEEWQLYVPDAISIGLGCGIHTGEVLVGNVGTAFRDQFTALGPGVNFASRIESKSGMGQILLSQSTMARVRNVVVVKDAGIIDDIKNIPGKFNLYEASLP